MVFSSNMASGTIDRLERKLGLPRTDCIGRYLGFPMDMAVRTNSSFNFLLNKIKEKLAGWKTNLLSRVSRVVLINSVVSSIPVHVMRCTEDPKGIYKAVDRVCSNFIQGILTRVERYT